MSKDLVATFRQSLEAVSGICVLADDLTQAAAYACRATVDIAGTAIAALGWNEAEIKTITAVCKESGLKLLAGDIRSHADEIFTALTPSQWAAAETGTILVDSANEDLRLATMLGEIHVAVLGAGAIAADLEALAEPMKRLLGSGAGYLACISGASRTADIERVLTIGVHGPTELHVVILPEVAP